MKPLRQFRVLFALVAPMTLMIALPVLAGAPVVVFSTDFEGALPPEFSAPGCEITGVQGYAGLGPVGRQFDGSFLRYTSVPILPTTLIVRNLPSHDTLSLRFLLAVIDSWDGTELMQISVDGNLLFNHWFQLATGDATSYEPPAPGALLSSSTNLGFTSSSYYMHDRAYDLGVEPAFLNLPHTADSVAVTWTIGAVSGPAASQWQGGADESWAIDAVSVEVATQTTDVANELAAGRLAVTALPNPTHGRALQLRLFLPVEGPATLELLSLTGRRLASREVGSLGPGQHAIDLAAGKRLAPGLYFARLSQGDRARVSRVVVTD